MVSALRTCSSASSLMRSIGLVAAVAASMAAAGSKLARRRASSPMALIISSSTCGERRERDEKRDPKHGNVAGSKYGRYKGWGS